MQLWEYEDLLKSFADTTLYEEAVKKTLYLQRNDNNPNLIEHKENSALYREFFRRDKHDYYYMAYNQAQLQLNRPKAVIKS